MLKILSGKIHFVHTGVSIISKLNCIDISFIETTKVKLINLKDKDIKQYILDSKPYDKSGSYGIQDWFAACIQSINGCFYNVMGLPLAKFYEEFLSSINTQ